MIPSSPQALTFEREPFLPQQSLEPVDMQKQQYIPGSQPYPQQYSQQYPQGYPPQYYIQPSRPYASTSPPQQQPISHESKRHGDIARFRPRKRLNDPFFFFFFIAQVCTPGAMCDRIPLLTTVPSSFSDIAHYRGML